MIRALVGMGDGGWGSGSKRSLGSGTLLGALILLSVKWRLFKGWSSFPQAPVECFRKLFLDRYLGILVTQVCGDEEEVGSRNELSFKVGQGDPCRGTRNPVRGHVPVRTVGQDLRTSYSSHLRTKRPREGPFQEQVL